MRQSRRQFLASVAGSAILSGMSSSSDAWYHGLNITSANVWMETPDVVGFIVYDDLPLMGNIITVAPDSHAYDTWFSATNPRSGNSEFCQVIGPTKTNYIFTAQPPASFVDEVNLSDFTKYSINNGLSITAVYYRYECNSATSIWTGAALTQGTGQRRTFYLKLSAAPSPGILYTITNSSAGLSALSLTFNEKLTRANGIKVNFGGHKPADTYKKAYLCSRLPEGPNNGVVDFASTYGVSAFHLIDNAGTIQFSSTITSRRAWNEQESPTDGYAATGIDIADTAQSWAVTAITTGATTAVTCPGHGFSNGDKARLLGISGMTQIDGVGQTGGPNGVIGASQWVAATVTVVDVDHITLNINTSSGYSAFSATPVYSTALGSLSNIICKCFNTNRAGTNVWECDYSAHTVAGTYRIFIPGYGVSDPITISNSTWQTCAGTHHEGTYCERLGIAITASAPTYSRGVALLDGTNGCTNYWSDLVSLVASETGAKIVGTTADVQVQSGMGAYNSDVAGAAITTQVLAAGTVTVTTTSPHGMTGTHTIQIMQALPASYSGAKTAVVTGASTFTYALSGSPGANTSPGVFSTGFLTTVRYNDRPAHQDAGDNDDIGVDHLAGIIQLIFTFNNLAAASRFTPFIVPLSSAVLNPTLFAGTDSLPPLFHEIAWHLEAYRTQQSNNPKAGTGAVPGGWGVGHFSSQVANFPEPIDYYHGTDPGGSITGQTVMAFTYASDAWTNMIAASCFAEFARIASDYGLTTLSNTYKQAAIDAYTWSNGIYTNITTRDSYYDGQLNLTARMGWTATQKNAFYVTHNARIIAEKRRFCATMYRLLGSVAGQTTYGDFIDAFVIGTTIFIQAAGTNYAVNDLITLTDGSIIVVNSLSGSSIATISILYSADSAVNPTNPVAQASTTGIGTGAAFNFGVNSSGQHAAPNYTLMTGTTGGYNYIVTPGCKATPQGYLLGHAFDGLSTQTDYTLSTTTCFQTMILPNNTSGGTKLTSPVAMVIAHLTKVFQNGAAAEKSSIYLQTLQAGLSFIQGANLPGKSFTNGLGPRSVTGMLHEDAWKLGFPGGAIPGQTIYGYFAWIPSGVFNFGLGSGADNTSNYLAAYTTGSFETSPNFGSKKLYWPNRYGASYWENTTEQRQLVFWAEFDVMGSSVANAFVSLYLHGWDGNTG